MHWQYRIEFWGTWYYIDYNIGRYRGHIFDMADIFNIDDIDIENH